QLGNAQNAGRYIFAGTRTDAPPFVINTDATGKVTGVTYQGNLTVSETEIASGTQIAADSPGQNNSGSGPRGLLVDSRFGADLFNHLISLQQNLTDHNTDAIAKINHAALAKDEENLIYHISNNGVLQTRLNSAATAASNRKNDLQQSLSKLAGADVTQAITDLTQAQSTYKAALASSSVLLQLQQSVLQYL